MNELQALMGDAYKEGMSAEGSCRSDRVRCAGPERCGPRDPFDVCDYSDPYEFWYWHPDDFYDFEDAEDYWQEHYRK